MKFAIKIQTVAKIGHQEEYVKVYGDDKVKRIATFHCEADAAEACRIIEMLRIDSAFKGTAIVIAPVD